MTQGWGLGAAASIAAVAVVAAVFSSDVAARQAPKSVWQGVYTDAQAARGQKTYVKNCASCHLEDLRGEGFAPALTDQTFTDRWGGGSVGDLFVIVQGTMPADNPKGLPPSEYADIVAYLLKSNMYPAGEAELGHDAAALKQVLFKKDARP